MKDAEIQRLQSCLQSQEASSQTMLIESLRQELTSMLENKHQGGCSAINISMQTRISTCIDYLFIDNVDWVVFDLEVSRIQGKDMLRMYVTFWISILQ